jgi:mono/diheme cytochrome c family protein
MSKRTTTLAFAFSLIALSGALARAVSDADVAAPGGSTSAVRVERGAYLVNSMGCHDCHTPWKLGPRGPEPDMSKALTGHPQDLVMPPPPALPPGPWIWMGGATNTAFAGPWGVSFTANLTPDPETGLGSWTEDMFIQALRTGRHEGKGRPILPPMPWAMVRNLNDEDLKSIFAYLQSLPPVKNRVPQPVDPPEGQ